MQCNCEHERHDDGAGNFAGCAHDATGDTRAELVGAICDDCAATCFAEDAAAAKAHGLTPYTVTRSAAAHWDIPTSILIPHADVADIWDTATLACGYWAADMQGAHGDPGAYYVREHEPQGGEYDYAFTGRDIATAVARIIAGRIPVAPSIRQDITDGDYDGDAADVIIQIAAFGEIVYG